MNGPSRASSRCGCGGKGCDCCDCCEGGGSRTPQSTVNRPGLSALRYRIGTHASFLQTMKARLASHALQDPGLAAGAHRPLAALRLRDDDDPSIALLDAWATVADVLTFYQERIANEGYLRTATEMRSMVELSRLVGYQPRPGVAASVHLAYTIDANVAQEIVVPRGARAQTVPGQDELPQSFETAQALKARAAWNKLGLRRTEPQQWSDIQSSGVLHLAGTQTRLKAGDALLIDPGSGSPQPYRVVTVEADAKADRSVVRILAWDGAAAAVKPTGMPAESAIGERIRRLIAPPSTPRGDALQLPRSLRASFDAVGDAGLKVLEAGAPALKATLGPAIAGYEAAAPAQPIRVWAMRLRAGLFGRLAPRRTRVQPLDGDDDADLAGRGAKTVDAGEWPIVGGVTVDNGKDVIDAAEAADTLYLDAAYDGIAPPSWIFIDGSAAPKGTNGMVALRSPLLVAQVKTVRPKVARADYGISGDSTALVLASAGTGKTLPWMRFTVDSTDFKAKNTQAVLDRDFQLIRRTAVYAQSEPLALAERPIDDDLCSPENSDEPGAAIELDGLYAGLEPGRIVIVSGERADVGSTRGVYASEAVMITAVVHDVRAAGSTPGPWTRVPPGGPAGDQGDGLGPQLPAKLPGDRNHTFIWLDKRLAYCYRRESVAIFGNVVKATHGETREETLGHGDGARPLQRFELKQSPLTHLPASTPSGAESTLQVLVNDTRWREAHGFVGQGAADRIYVVRTDDKGRTVVQFGNGREGARLPTGIANVKATYRSGIGRAGNVAPGQIQQLATRPLGVKEVTNPLRASGGADRERHDQVRRNAPLAVKALDRLVSTADHADFARTFAGIGLADAQEISDGRRSIVHVTVAGIDDGPLDRDSDLLIHLRRALRELSDPYQPLAVEPRELRLLIVSAGLRIEPDQLWEPVVTRVRRALLEAFGFDRRELAQGVAGSEVLSVMQAVRGVSHVDLDVFGAIDTAVLDDGVLRPLTPRQTADAVAAVVAAGVAPAVQAARARRSPDGTAVLPAQLVLLSGDVAETLVLNQLT